MPYAAAIFDMDGTILDTLEDLWISVNYAFAAHGLSACSRETTRRNLGNGMDYLISHCAPQGTSPELLRVITSDFKAHYAKQCEINTKPYEGILELLDKLIENNIACAVVSNKGDFAVQELVEHHFKNKFRFAVGERDGISRKPAPDTVFAALHALNIAASDCVYIGDSEVDIQTAANAHMDCVSVTWGFRDIEDLRQAGAIRIVCSTDELFSTICS